MRGCRTRSSPPAPAAASTSPSSTQIIAPWFADKTRAEIQKTAQAKGVPFGPIFTPAELLQTEQYVARGFLAKMTHPDIGKLLIPQLPVQWNGRSFAPRPAPPLERAELAA